MTDPRKQTWFGQPRGLTILFLTQMWELFSYYGMRTLLVYYMTKQLLFPQEKASLIYGGYVAAAYFTPLFGGIVADQWLGKRRAVILGASTMALGHFLMTFEAFFYLALVTIALGNGLFLPSLPSQINDLYHADDPRRGRAYNVYYVGLNLGAFLAPFVCGSLGELYGWHYGFGAAGLGMLTGLVIYLIGQKYLPREAPPGIAFKTEDREESSRPWLILLLIALAVTIFRGAYEQIGNTVPLWTDMGIDRSLGRFVIPMTWFQSLNPLLVITLTPLLLYYWRRRAAGGKETPQIRKMAFGALIVAGSYVLICLVAKTAGTTRAGWPWLVLFCVVLTVGELYILPTGLGLFARLAPARLGATTVASWYLTIFTGSLLAGAVGTWWSRTSHSGFFLILSLFATTAAVLLSLLHAVVPVSLRKKFSI
jgi:POT family proton-dependent oligopeptide transporter